MSRPSIEKISCGGCGHEQSFTVWQSLNVTLDPDKKKELISGELTRVTCEVCGWSSDVLYGLLYHDMEGKFMVYLVPDGAEAGLEELAFVTIMKGYRFRRVATRNELIEKIQIFDINLDDRVMEALKFTILGQMQEQGDRISGEFLFAGCFHENNEPVIKFEEAGMRAVSVPYGGYQKLQKLLGRVLSKGGSKEGEWLRVNMGYAGEMLRKVLK